MLKTPILMPNKPWHIERKKTHWRSMQVILWLILRTLNRLINALPIEINFGNRIINHKYFLNNSNWNFISGEHLFGYMGVVVDRHGLKNHSRARLYKRAADIPIFFDKPVEVKDEVYVFESNNPYNYFHFLYDFIFPLSVLRINYPEVKVYLPFDLTNWQTEWLKIIGHHQYFHAKVNGNLNATRVKFFENFLDKENNIRKPEEFEFFKTKIANFIKSKDISEIQEKIYIRRKKSSMGRNILNQREIIKYLSDLNFKIIDLDEVSVLQQLTLFKKASIIVSPHDAGLSNLVAAGRDCHLIELSPAQTIGRYDMYKNICNMSSIKYSLVLSTNCENYIPGKNFEIEIPKILNLLKF